MDSILLVLARVPRPGFVKTRLAARIGEDGAIAVYEAMLIDLLAKYASVPNLAVSLVHPHDDTEETLWGLLKHHGLPQERFSFIRGVGALDRDIAHAVSRSLGTYLRVALTAVDMPQYGPDRLSELFRALDKADVAFHPNEDDGCHPCAVRVWCDLWTGNDSRIPGYIERWADRARKAGLTVSRLDPVFDVDRYEDLIRLVRDYGTCCPRTAHAFSLLSQPS